MVKKVSSGATLPNVDLPNDILPMGIFHLINSLAAIRNWCLFLLSKILLFLKMVKQTSRFS